jgi:hypothetical protein
MPRRAYLSFYPPPAAGTGSPPLAVPVEGPRWQDFGRWRRELTSFHRFGPWSAQIPGTRHLAPTPTTTSLACRILPTTARRPAIAARAARAARGTQVPCHPAQAGCLGETTCANDLRRVQGMCHVKSPAPMRLPIDAYNRH